MRMVSATVSPLGSTGNTGIRETQHLAAQTQHRRFKRKAGAGGRLIEQCGQALVVSYILVCFGVIMDAVRKVQQLLGFFLCKVKGSIKCLINSHPFLMVYLKTKKMTDILQKQAGCKQRSAGILCGFQGFLTQNLAVFVEIDDIFDFSDTPWIKRCHARGRHTFGKYVQTGSAAKLAANLAYYIIPARQIKPINPKMSAFLRQFYKSGQNARQSRCSLYRTFTSWWLNSSWTASKISASQPTQARAKPR